jgi:DNA-binding HxlR family transcriptional regulator
VHDVAVRTYGQYCPIARGAEIFAERWTPLVIRNLHLGARTFSEIREGVPHMSKTLLSERLRALERVGVVSRERGARDRSWTYRLTRAGEELADLAFALGSWGARWLDVSTDHTDPLVVLWAWRNDVDKVGRLPKRRLVIRFDMTSGKHRRYWLLFEHGRSEVCVKPPGGDDDIVVETDPATLMLVHMGRLSMQEASALGRWRVDGDAALVRRFPTWGGRSAFADVRPAGGQLRSGSPVVMPEAAERRTPSMGPSRASSRT